MTAPPPPEQVEVAARIAATLELWAKIGGTLVLLWGFVAKVIKPYQTWRRDSMARVIREVLAPELGQLREILAHEDGCASRLEVVLRQMQDLFGDHDHLVTIAMDNRDRLDETNDLLDSIGFASDRRHPDRIARIEAMVTALDERRRARRRASTPVPTPPPFPKQERSP